MELSVRNKKIALARWSKIQAEEQKRILNTEKGMCLKAALCGFLAGDGSIQVRKGGGNWFHHEIRFFPDDSLMLRKFCEDMKKVYGKLPKITRNGKCFEVRITSRTMVEDLLKYATFGNKSWTLPNFI